VNRIIISTKNNNQTDQSKVVRFILVKKL